MSSELPPEPPLSSDPFHKSRDFTRKPPVTEELDRAETSTVESQITLELEDDERDKGTGTRRMAQMLRESIDKLREYLAITSLLIAMCFLQCTIWLVPKGRQESDTASDME